MRFQDFAITSIERSSADLVRTVRAMPADKLDWKPMEEGRSALDQLQEVAQMPTFLAAVLQARAMPNFNPQQMGEARQARKAWTTVDACEEQLKKNDAALFKAIRNFPDEELEKTVTLPFGGGMVRSMADIMLTHYWNATYHLGQINYIQTLLGDRDMH